jgi:hypothetical protein
MINQVIDKIVAYELGDMNEEETIEFFQELMDTGLVWNLQGHYSRAAQAMVDAGLLSAEGNR